MSQSNVSVAADVVLSNANLRTTVLQLVGREHADTVEHARVGQRGAAVVGHELQVERGIVAGQEGREPGIHRLVALPGDQPADQQPQDDREDDEADIIGLGYQE